MVGFDLKYVDEQRDRNGRVQYWYFRRNGRRWRLPGKPLSKEFMAEYRRLLEATEPAAPTERRPHPPGSFGALALDYLASPEFLGTKPNTRRIYRLILEPLAERHGHKPVAGLERRHVKKMRDERAETPGMANLVVRVVGRLMSYAVDNDYRADNPAAGLKQFKLGEWRAWTDDELAAFEAHWAPGSMQRRAYALARYTGQRCGDLARMTQAHRKGGSIRVVQEKTGAELWIPEHSGLTAELATAGEHMSLLTASSGSAFKPIDLTRWFADAISKAGLPNECVLHGLRKVAARTMADAGCSVHEIMSVTGHRSLKEVQRYTKGADQRKLATAAIHRLEQNEKRTSIAKQPPSQTAKQKLKD